MKRINISIITALLVLLISMINFIPVLASDSGFTKIESGFTLDPSQPGILLKPGSTIHHLKTGITEVYCPDKTLLIKSLDSESAQVVTPFGVKNATDIYGLPNGSKIDYGSRKTQIYNDDNLILTIVYDRERQQRDVTNGWVAQTTSDGLTIDYFEGFWNVPNEPPNDDNIAFYFNGLESDNQQTLLQPVLQWNQVGYRDDWSIQAWALWPNGGVSKGGVTVVDQGDLVGGKLDIVGDYWWVLVNVNGGGWNGIMVSTNILGTTNIKACTALEVWRRDSDPFEDDDLPGDSRFRNMSFSYDGSRVDIDWDPYIPPYGLDLDVYYDSSVYGSWVYYDTPN